MPKSYASVLALHRIKVNVHLGVGEEERGTPQPVFIDVRLYFPNAPAASASDNADYTCYYSLSQKIYALALAKPYRLIEYLVHEIHRLLRGLLAEDIRIAVTLTKPSIMLPYVEGGASYTHTDLPAAAWVAPV